MTQLSFKWPALPSHAPEDFIVSEANEAAVRFLETWPGGQSGAMLLSGPQACGKTHLARVWARRTGAVIIDGNTLGRVDSDELWGTLRHAVLEDIHTITRQTALFHLLRHAEVHGSFLLLTARVPAVSLHFALADLRSRLLAMPQASIHAPDENLLKGYLFKCFADRQLHVGEEVIDYLVKRMERSFASAYALVETIEERALARAAEITVPFVKSVLE